MQFSGYESTQDYLKKYSDYKAKKKNIFSNIQVAAFLKCLLFYYSF